MNAPPPMRPDPTLIGNAEGDEKARLRTVAAAQRTLDDRSARPCNEVCPTCSGTGVVSQRDIPPARMTTVCCGRLMDESSKHGWRCLFRRYGKRSSVATTNRRRCR